MERSRPRLRYQTGNIFERSLSVFYKNQLPETFFGLPPSLPFTLEAALFALLVGGPDPVAEILAAVQSYCDNHEAQDDRTVLILERTS